jgi:quercetin dioxygenase-like cupin family protein
METPRYFRPRHFASPVEREIVAEAWRRRGYSCGSFADPPGQRWMDFTHKVDEVLTVVEGRLAVSVAGQRLQAMPGDEVFIPTGTLHSVENVADSTTRWLYGYAQK